MPIEQYANPRVVTTQSGAERSAQDARQFIVSVPRVTVALLANLRVIFRNPAGSGKDFMVTSLAIGTSASVLSYASMFINPTTGLPVANTPPGNTIPALCTYIGRNAGAAQTIYDTNATPLSGGVAVGEIPLMAGSYTRFNEGIYIIPPGTTMGINVAMAVNVNALIKLFYTEV